MLKSSVGMKSLRSRLASTVYSCAIYQMKPPLDFLAAPLKLRSYEFLKVE